MEITSSDCVLSHAAGVSSSLAAIGDNDRGALVSSRLLYGYAEMWCHIIVGGAGAGGGAITSKTVRVIEVLQGVASQRVGCVLVQIGPGMRLRGVEGWAEGGRS